MDYLKLTIAILLARLIEWIVIALVRTVQQWKIERDDFLQKNFSNRVEDAEQ